MSDLVQTPTCQEACMIFWGRPQEIYQFPQKSRRADILTLSIQGVPQLYLRMAGKHIPVQYAGDGVLKLLQVCIAAMEIKNG